MLDNPSEKFPITKCQYCIDRQAIEPGEAIGIYMNLPICDDCLGTIMDNVLEPSEQLPPTEAPIDRKAKALELLDKFEELCDEWPLLAEEVLLSHDDFYNHRPPAIINLSLDQIKQIYSRRKSLLFAIRHKEEHWYTLIEDLKKSERAKNNVEGIKKGRSEASKVAKPTSAIAAEAEKKLAKALGITVEQLRKIKAEEQTKRYDAIVQDTTKVEAKIENESSKALKELQAKSAASAAKPKYNPITGKLIS